MSGHRPFWRARLLPAFLALAGLNALVLAAWTGPRAWRQRNAAARSTAAEREVERLRGEAAELRERADAIRRNAEDAQRFYETLAGEEKTELLSTLEAIEELARAPGLRPGGRQLKREPLEGASVERVSVTVPLEGSYAQLVGFLSGVERSPRFLTVDRVSLRGDPEEAATLQVQIGTYLRRAREEKPRGRS